MANLKLSGKMVTIPIDKDTGEATVSEDKRLTEAEWRTIHNALVIYQCGLRQASERQTIQRLMDRVRDVFIAPLQDEREINELRDERNERIE